MKVCVQTEDAAAAARDVPLLRRPRVLLPPGHPPQDFLLLQVMRHETLVTRIQSRKKRFIRIYGYLRHVAIILEYILIILLN